MAQVYLVETQYLQLYLAILQQQQEVGESDFSDSHLCSRLDVPFLRLNATQLCAAPGLAGQDGWGLLRLQDCVREHISVCACVCVCANVHCVNREVILFTHLGVRGGRRPPS